MSLYLCRNHAFLNVALLYEKINLQYSKIDHQNEHKVRFILLVYSLISAMVWHYCRLSKSGEFWVKYRGDSSISRGDSSNSNNSWQWLFQYISGDCSMIHNNYGIAMEDHPSKLYIFCLKGTAICFYGKDFGFHSAPLPIGHTVSCILYFRPLVICTLPPYLC